MKDDLEVCWSCQGSGMMLGDDGDPCICSHCKYDGVVASDDDAEMSDYLGPWPEKMYLLHPSIKTFAGMVSNPERREYVRADRIEELVKERERLALAICGGEDAPGYANAQPVEVLERVARDNAAWGMRQVDQTTHAEAKLAKAV